MCGSVIHWSIVSADRKSHVVVACKNRRPRDPSADSLLPLLQITTPFINLLLTLRSAYHHQRPGMGMIFLGIFLLLLWFVFRLVIMAALLWLGPFHINIFHGFSVGVSLGLLPYSPL